MKKMIQAVFAVFIALSVMATAFAAPYPYTNATYIPNLRTDTVTVASGVAGTTNLLNNINTTAVQFEGTCPNLSGRLEGSVGTSWFTLLMYPNGATSTASAVSAATTVGAWAANTSGLNKVRVNNSGASGVACTSTLSGSSGSFNLPH